MKKEELKINKEDKFKEFADLIDRAIYANNLLSGKLSEDPRIRYTQKKHREEEKLKHDIQK